MSTTPTTPLLVDIIDSYYYYVKDKVQLINPLRQFGGIVQARDWPMKQAELGVPYLAVKLDVPRAYGKSVSWFRPRENFEVHWVWMIQGDNLLLNQQGANRGNKYRLNMELIQEILSGSYPGFCAKNQYNVADDGSGNPVKLITPYDPPEYISWSIPKFTDRVDDTSGILSSEGIVGINGFVPAPPAIVQ